MSFPGVRHTACALIIASFPIVAAGQQSPPPATGAPRGGIAAGAIPEADRPFGTLREQAAMQQEWLKKRLDTFLPALMRRHGIDFWVVPMREYNEDPVFSSITAPETFYARRRTITCSSTSAPPRIHR